MSSQQVSRRNAQRAAIVCAQRRREREAVERFLTELQTAAVPRQRHRRTQRA